MKTGITPFLHTTLACTAFLLASQQVSAQNEGRWYDVEMIVFKRLDSSVLTEEFWPSDLELAYPEEVQYLFEKPEEVAEAVPAESLTEAITPENIETISGDKLAGKGVGKPAPVSFQLLPKKELQLTRYRNSLGSNPGYRVLFHKGWQQQMQGKGEALPIVISGGEIAGGNPELQGFIKLHVARFLHINTDLWLSHEQIALAQNIDLNEFPSNLPERPLTPEEKEAGLRQALLTDSPPLFSTEERINEKLLQLSEDVLQGTTAASSIGQEAVKTAGVVVLKQHRRMRSKELHYIDHPLMGLIIYFNPIDYKAPEQAN